MMLRSLVIGLLLCTGLLTTMTACGFGGGEPTGKSEEQQAEPKIQKVDAKSESGDTDDEGEAKTKAGDQDQEENDQDKGKGNDKDDD